MREKQEKKLHIAMYPWFAMGHITPLFHLANNLANKGHKVSFLLPPKAHSKLIASHNHRHHHLITFIPVAVPAVEGLPIGAETTNDIPFGSQFPLMAAMDLTYPTIDSLLSQLKPDVVFFDYARWVPDLARKHGFKSVFFLGGPMSYTAYMSPRARRVPPGVSPIYSDSDLMRAPPGFPSSAIGLRAHEARSLATSSSAALVYFWERIFGAIEESDAVCSQSCGEMERRFGDYFEKCHGKPVLWAGRMVPEPPVGSERLDEELDGWLRGCERRNVHFPVN